MCNQVEMSFLQTLKGKKVLLYVSSSHFKKEYLMLPFDYVVLTNRECFRNRGIRVADNKVVMLPFDNNKTLRILKDLGIKIQCFVGMQDGCNEGGNYECVNSNSFFGRLSPILDNRVLYINNHWDGCRQKVDPVVDNYGFLDVHYEVINPVEGLPGFVESISFCEYENDERNKTVCLIQRKNPQTIEKMIGNIMVKISHSSVWDYESEFDCIIHSDLDDEAEKNYCPANTEGRSYISLSQIKEKDPKFLLEEAQKNRWKKIGLIPYMYGHYNEFIEHCRNWNGDYPEQVHFFHLEDRDMVDLRNLLEH